METSSFSPTQWMPRPHSQNTGLPGSRSQWRVVGKTLGEVDRLAPGQRRHAGRGQVVVTRTKTCKDAGRSPTGVAPPVRMHNGDSALALHCDGRQSGEAGR